MKSRRAFTARFSAGWVFARRGSFPTTPICAARPMFSMRARKSPCSSARARWARRTKFYEVADILGAGISKALLGKAVIPDEAPGLLRLHRPAGHKAELGHDDGVRHAADDRQFVSLFGIPAQGRPGARRAD